MTRSWVLEETDLPLEVLILLVAGVMMLVTGILLFPVAAGSLPYYENGVYGMLLVIFALQMITMGKTPFGDLRRSIALLAAGLAIAGVGVVTCFVPGLLGGLPRVLLFICFTPGGAILFLHMVLAPDKLRSWVRYGGVFRHLIFSAGAVYLWSILIGLLVIQPALLATGWIAVIGLVYGGLILYLAGVLRIIYRRYPEGGQPAAGEGELTTDQAMLLLMCLFMILLGGLLVPVSLGLLPFSGSAQLGLLMVIIAVQMLALGSTPIGAFPRSRLLVAAGFVFAVLGIVSIVIPGILVPLLTVLVGVLNILGGVITLVKVGIPLLQKSRQTADPVPPPLMDLYRAQIIMNLLTILFGTSMLISGLIPGLVIGVVLAANGCVLGFLLRTLIILEKLKKAAEQGAAAG